MNGKPCIHCGAGANYVSGSNCEFGYLHHACSKEFHNSPKPEAESPQNQQRSERAFENSKVAVEERTQKWGRIALKVILIGLCLAVATPIALLFSYAAFRSGGNDGVDELVGLGIALLLVIWATMSSKKWGVAVAGIAILLLFVFIDSLHLFK